MDSKTEPDVEFEAMRQIYAALKDLEPAAQSRVIDYVLRRLSLGRDEARAGSSFSPFALAQEAEQGPGGAVLISRPEEAEFEGVSPIARKWAMRNGLREEQLSALFSLGGDEIELVSRTVPGASKREKMRSVLLLTATASYLGTGAARVPYEKLRETLGHYNAYDATNFSTYMKAMAPEVGGSKEGGYALTARGLAAAAELVKQNAGA
jgi:hypothetical protein